MNSSSDVEVKFEDLIIRSRTEGLLDFLGGFSFAMLGFLPLSVGTGLFDWLLLKIGAYFLSVWFAVGIVGGVFTYCSRPRIPRFFFVGREIATGFRKYRSFLIWSFVGAAIMGIVGLALTYAPKPWHETSLGLTLAGVAYFGLTPSLTATQVLKPDNLARLSLLRFIRSGVSFRDERVWLTRGLVRVEDRVSEDGILRVERGILYLACSYQFYKGLDIRPDLLALSDWVVTKTPPNPSSIESLLTSASEAKSRGFSPVPTIVDKIKERPGWVDSIIAGAIIYFLLVVAAAFGIGSPVIDGRRKYYHTSD